METEQSGGTYHGSPHKVPAWAVVADVQLAEASLLVVVERVAAAHHVGIGPDQLEVRSGQVRDSTLSYLGVVTGVHPEVEGLNVPGPPLISGHLVKPSHHVPRELGLVLVGRHPVVAPCGGHVLPNGVPV